MFHVKHYYTIYSIFIFIFIFISYYFNFLSSHILIYHLPPSYPLITFYASHFLLLLYQIRFQSRFHSHLSSLPTLSHLAINPISYHISYNIFCYPILSYHISISSHIVTITTYIVFNTTYNAIHITYHILQYYLISLSIYYVNSQVRLC